MPQPRRRKRPAPLKDWKAIALGRIALGETVTDAAIAAAVTRAAVYKAQQEDEAFAEAYKDALEQGTDLLEKEARHRALHGSDDPVIHKGELSWVWVDEHGNLLPPARKGKPRRGKRRVPLTIKRKSDGLLMMMLRGRRPGIYGDQLHHTTDGSMKPTTIILTHTAPPPLPAVKK